MYIYIYIYVWIYEYYRKVKIIEVFEITIKAYSN